MNKVQKYDYLIVGAGLYGSLCAYFLAMQGYTVKIIDKRNHIGGNCYIDKAENIDIHKYGAHIYHTNNEVNWKFINKFVKFHPFVNSPIAITEDNELYNLPFNMNTFSKLWNVHTPAEAQEIINKQIAEAKKDLIEKNGDDIPRNLEEQALVLVGRDIYNKLIKSYTEKQWGRKCSELPANIIKRIPIRLTFDNNYFNDEYQGVADYTELFKQLLKSSNIYVQLNTNFVAYKNNWRKHAKKLIYTGSIDEFYDYKFGKLEYRTVDFKTELLETDNFQGNAVVNYTGSNVPYTRVIEHKHFMRNCFNNETTIISYEYPVEYSSDKEPCYPINNERNMSLFNKYKELADKETDVIFGGRLGEYKYYNMDEIVDELLSKIINNNLYI